MKRITAAALLLTAALAAPLASAGAKGRDRMEAYLFVYFTGNAPWQEQICYAISDDGYSYTPLGGGRPVIASDTVALTGCMRDPHILRCRDGRTFLMVATDMKSSLGWDSNRGIVMLRSSDLVHWTHAAVHFPSAFPRTCRGVTRVWAPETIYDSKARRYMVYYSMLTDDGTCPYDRIFYQYASRDFTRLEGEPRLLFDNGSAAIDGDIVFDPATRLYHLFYKSESGGGIYRATSPGLTPAPGREDGSQWERHPARVEVCREAVEGVGVCRAIDGGSWIVMYDCYGSGHYQFCRSEDLRTFRRVADTPLRGAFTPRHGTVIPITRAEKDRLLLRWPAAASEE